jgi:hypothetical protein
MTIRNTYAAEAWDKVYNAFSQINFTSYDYDTVKESLLQYLKIYHPENFNDFIESSEMIALLEMFAYVAELLAYRIDMASHENFITTAQRKQSVLKLARLISYRASRNIPARGLVKINTVKTTEDIFDSLGNNIAGTTITWNDPNNTNWKEQFFLVMNKTMTSKFGQPSKAFQIGDVSMQLYTLNNAPNTFRNGVFAFSASSTSEQVQMELVPSDIDSNGPFERAPDMNAQFNIIYAADGKGDGSDFTGFLGFVKQGTLLKTDYAITEPIANRRIAINAINVNDTDVWVYRVNDLNAIIENWIRVETLNEQNIYFNNTEASRKKYEIETLENDQIALVFGDGNFSDTAVGNFQFWARVSVNQTLTIPKNRISGQQMSFSYVNKSNVTQECALTFSLTAPIQNNAASESIEHVRQSAPSTYYAQNRMVNGQDYNTYMLKDPTILRLKTVNRTFAGQPKYIEWNDSSRTYENVKLFGDDLTLLYDITADQVDTTSSSKTLIDSFIEPVFQSSALLNVLSYVLSASNNSEGIISYPRRKFIEDNRQIYFQADGVTPVAPYASAGDGSLNEKTVIQSALDQHWYGEAVTYAIINGIRHGVILDPVLNPKDDSRIYMADLPRTIDSINTWPPGDTGSGVQQVGRQPSFGLKFNRFLGMFGNGTIELSQLDNEMSDGYLSGFKNAVETLTIEMTSDGVNFTVISNLRGKLPNYSLDMSVTNASSYWSAQTVKKLPVDFSIVQGTTVFEQGDAFIIDLQYYPGDGWGYSLRNMGSAIGRQGTNLNGWWELIPSNIIASAFPSGPNAVNGMTFDPNNKADGTVNPNSWVFLVFRNDNPGTGEVKSWSIFSRNMKVVAESLSTKFWFNQDTQIIDSSTKKPVFDKIRILRSNLDENNLPLQKADVYDTVGFVYDNDGVVNFNRIELLPTDTINFTQAGDSTPDNLLQFISFSKNSFDFFVIDTQDPKNPITGSALPITTPATFDYYFNNSSGKYEISVPSYDTQPFVFANDSINVAYVMLGGVIDTSVQFQILRRRTVKNLDFMWQHFSPVTHLIDPSVTNIHDAFLMTRGYYTNVTNYIKGYTDIEPQPPTPLDLRTSYGYLLTNKMLSDTVVLHSGRIKLLFGAKADQRLRAIFKVVKAQGATFSDERIKSETVGVIDTYFDIQNWEFGDKFYATELISLIHQKMPTQIASVVLVPTYSVNSFGSLFTIDSGFDEILQSAATVNDIEIVDALTPTVLRQVR